ncbi:hypothetical protein NP590_02715 [Methylomonas sp. SURF-2]|uniref:Polymerase nucleotidyl transferase domain-containing protein n=1 Tax=Methylomonas subterranea TaxID=2952225 RepID=A0ABT1TD39_9GAMM|nr:hypothetical protein [Methylomonas sp. SURF-2]MCQ8103007.1 hypothetical protein [Methylomonas sp. SURF-2]
MNYQAKDFVLTDQGLLFAVVADGLESGKVLCFLRYMYRNGQWQKVGTEVANAFLREYFPEYLYYSSMLDTQLHAVDTASVSQHFQPGKVLQELLQLEVADPVINDLRRLCGLLKANHLDLGQFGVTGSILVGMQNHASDMDLVCYDRATFHRARNIIQALIAKDQIQALNDDDWLGAYQRRACDFALDEYIWHEQRKYNKAIFNQRKFDLSLKLPAVVDDGRQFQKAGFVRIQAGVIDDSLGFDYPAEFVIDHLEIASVVCFTATYVGQAKAGERIEVSGQLEVDEQGRRRVVVGSTREAIGEFIRVLR